MDGDEHRRHGASPRRRPRRPLLRCMRDRYVDLLRVASLGVVIVGHWLMVIVYPTDAGVRATNVLALVPALQPVTWLLQVMPVFFLVGGFSHATALASVRR